MTPMRRSTGCVRLALLGVVLAAAGCSPDYPMDKPGTWRISSEGSNDANLRVMLVNPRDLEAGFGDSGSVGPLAAAPVRRVMTGQRYPLPAVSAARVQSVAQPPQQGAPPKAGQ
jgi:hypothetical protein